MGLYTFGRTSKTKHTNTPICVLKKKIIKIPTPFLWVIVVSLFFWYYGLFAHRTLVAVRRPSYVALTDKYTRDKSSADIAENVCSNSARKAFLQDACHVFRERDNYTLMHIKDMFDHLLCDDKNRVIFCDAPKTGSTFFKYLWLKYTRNIHATDPTIHYPSFLRKHGLRYLDTYSIAEIQTRLQNYFKFMVFRHPKLRLLSAYHSKMLSPTSYYRNNFVKLIVQQYGNVSANQPKGDNINFEMFINYVVDRNPVNYDHHWRPITFLCHPCEIRYDYIINLETSNANYPELFSKVLNMSPSQKRLLLNELRMHKALTDSNRVKKYYRHIPMSHMKSLERTYQHDTKLFGYTWKNTTLSYGCRAGREGTDCC